MLLCARLQSLIVFFCKQKSAYDMRISDWSSDVCSSDLRTTDGSLSQRRDHLHPVEHAQPRIAAAHGPHLSADRSRIERSPLCPEPAAHQLRGGTPIFLAVHPHASEQPRLSRNDGRDLAARRELRPARRLRSRSEACGITVEWLLTGGAAEQPGHLHPRPRLDPPGGI